MKSLLMIIAALGSLICGAQPGRLDPTFNPDDPGFGAYDQCWGTPPHDGGLLADGSVVLIGNFGRYDSVRRNQMMKLLPDGRADSSFHSGFDDMSWLFDILQQPDGKLLVAGQFSTYDGAPHNGIVRLHTDGTLDDTFTADYGASGQSWGIGALGMQADGKIIVSGAFFDPDNGLQTRIIRLFPDGSVDNTFFVQLTAPFLGGIMNEDHLLVLPDQRILVSGNFHACNGVDRPGLARLLSNGELDTAFDPGLGCTLANPNEVTRVFFTDLGGGAVLLWGDFDHYNGVPMARLAKITQTGALDTSLDPGSGPIGINGIRHALVRPDQSIIVCGWIYSYAGRPCDNVIRILPNGSLDTLFALQGGANADAVFAMNYPPDRIFLAGNFRLYEHVGRSGVALLEKTGQLVHSYADLGPGANALTQCLAKANDDRVYVGGGFTGYDHLPRNGIVRIHADGSIDPGFEPDLTLFRAPFSMCTQPDDKLLVAGPVMNYDEHWNSVSRLLPDGTQDETFFEGHADQGYILTLALADDTSSFVGGEFLAYNGRSSPHIMHLLSNGQLDTTFLPTTTGAQGFNGNVHVIRIDTEGRLLVGGDFTTYQGQSAVRLIRLFSDGTRDTSFQVPPLFNHEVRDISILTDGSVLVAGRFSYSTIPSGIERIVRLLPDGAIDHAFNAPSTGPVDIRSIAVQSDGRIIIAGDAMVYNTSTNSLIRLEPNGAADTTFIPGTSTGGYHQIMLTNDNGCLIAGSFIQYQGQGRDWLAKILLDDVGMQVEDEAQASNTFFPNPSSGIFHLSGTPGLLRSCIVRDITGRLVQQQSIANSSERFTVDLSAEPAGIYFVTLTGPEGNSTSRLVKE